MPDDSIPLAAFMYSYDYAYYDTVLKAAKPSQISMDGTTITWVQPMTVKSPDGLTSFTNSKILLYDLQEAAFLEDHELNDHLLNPLIAQSTSREQPQVWREFVMYLEIDFNANRSSVWLFNTVKKSREPLHLMGTNSSFFR